MRFVRRATRILASPAAMLAEIEKYVLTFATLYITLEMHHVMNAT